MKFDLELLNVVDGQITTAHMKYCEEMKRDSPDTPIPSFSDWEMTIKNGIYMLKKPFKEVAGNNLEKDLQIIIDALYYILLVSKYTIQNFKLEIESFLQNFKAFVMKYSISECGNKTLLNLLDEFSVSEA